MDLRAPAILIAARQHGETAVIARMMTAEHGLVADGCQDLDVEPGLFHDGRPDEHRGERLVEPDDIEVRLEGVPLAAERVAPNREIDGGQG